MGADDGTVSLADSLHSSAPTRKLLFDVCPFCILLIILSVTVVFC